MNKDGARWIELSEDELRIVAWLRRKADWHSEQAAKSHRAGDRDKTEYFAKAWAHACHHANQIEEGAHRIDESPPQRPRYFQSTTR